ncbi:MAG: xanthine dehydrogenase family protein subunit M [Quisquiliibacterium sp.]
MYQFTYHRATGLADALARVAQDPAAKLLSGGMTLLPSMKHRLAAPSQLIDIAQLPELRGIAREGDTLTVGAAMRHVEVELDETVRNSIASLAAAAGQIGDAQVRARGTIGGSIANNDPAADYPAAVLALKAVVLTDRREIDAQDFFLGMFTTALQEGEIVKAVRFAIPARSHYAKFRHPASGYAMTGVYVAEFDANGAREVRVAVTGAAPSVFRWEQAEAALGKKFSVASLNGLTVSEQGLNADLHAPASYRANLARVMTLRAVAQLTGEQA